MEMKQRLTEYVLFMENIPDKKMSLGSIPLSVRDLSSAAPYCR